MIKLDLEKEEKLLLNEKPEGNNNLTSRAAFFQEKLYEKVSFENPTINETTPLNFIYKFQHYGRIDNNLNSIILKKENLVKIPTKLPNIYTLNVMADSLREFNSFWAYLKNKNSLNRESVLYNIEISKGFIDINLEYYKLMQFLYKRFTQFISKKNLDKRILDFDSFLQNFTYFLDKETPLIPITISSFIKSRYMDPCVSGLCVEFGKQENHSDDKRKYEIFIKDLNFPVFKQSIERFGMIIDKQSPWRVFLNINSPYFVDKNLNLNNFYQQNYKNALNLNYDFLIDYVINFYNSYVSGKQAIEFLSYQNCKDRNYIKIIKQYREKLSKEGITALKEDEMLYRFYTFVRGRENNSNITQEFFEQIWQAALEFKNGIDKDSSMRYIENKIRPVLSEKKNRNFIF